MRRLVVAFMAAAILQLGGIAMAAGTNTLAVSASVVGTCKFDFAASTLNFGALDPALATDATASTSTTFWCTKGAAYSISDDSGLNELVAGSPRMQNTVNPLEYIPYSLSYVNSGAGLGKTAAITLNLNGTVLNADYVNAEAGNYSDTVTITVTP